MCTDKLGEAAVQSESAVASSSAGITELVDEARETPEENDKTQVTKPSARKGRRGAMRVTIEPEKPEEEDARETSTRRGRKAEMVVTDKGEDQAENAAKETSASTSTAGRKRGRQTAKTTVVEEAEEGEAPTTKSRRGRRGKAIQAETTSVSETPLKTVSFQSMPEALQGGGGAVPVFF